MTSTAPATNEFSKKKRRILFVSIYRFIACDAGSVFQHQTLSSESIEKNTHLFSTKFNLCGCHKWADFFFILNLLLNISPHFFVHGTKATVCEMPQMMSFVCQYVVAFTESHSFNRWHSNEMEKICYIKQTKKSLVINIERWKKTDKM